MAYPIKQFGAHHATYNRGRGGKSIEFIFIHYTGTQASAYNNCKYFSGGNRFASAHYFLDGSGTIWQSVPDSDTAWAVGNLDVNQRSLSIEVVSDGRNFTQAEINELTWLVQYLMKKHGVPASKVLRHYDVADYVRYGHTVDPHKRCPAPYVNQDKWRVLHAQITGGTTTSTSSKPSSTAKQVDVDGWTGKNDVMALQQIFGCSTVDGIISGQPRCNQKYHVRISSLTYGTSGSDLVAAMQRRTGAKVDRYLGYEAISKWQRFLVNQGFKVAVDGSWGAETARATQKWINKQLQPKVEQKPVEKPKAQTSEIHRVQVGAFAVKENAEKLAKELSDKGYKPFITTKES